MNLLFKPRTVKKKKSKYKKYKEKYDWHFVASEENEIFSVLCKSSPCDVCDVMGDKIRLSPGEWFKLASKESNWLIFDMI